MIASKQILDAQRGASMIEVLMVMAIIAMMTPFVYSQVSAAAQEIQDIAMARRIVATRDGVLNFVRRNQDNWVGVDQIRLGDQELGELSDLASVGFVDKYDMGGVVMTDVYLGIDPDRDGLRAARIARHIGDAAAVVADDGVAYGDMWAVTAPEFRPGMVIYRVSRNASGDDKTRYLHRVSSGNDDLNTMMRDLNMGGHDLFDVGTVMASSGRIGDTAAMFIESDLVTASNAYFVSGANMDGNAVSVGNMRVTGDVTGFRSITAQKLNGDKFGTVGRVITDRASITSSVNVSRDLTLKADTSRTISGFSGIQAGVVMTPFLAVDEMVFYENFGLTVSGELLMSTNPPIRLGAWSFPSVTPPRFVDLAVARAPMPDMPDADEFGVIMSGGWKDVAAQPITPGGNYE